MESTTSHTADLPNDANDMSFFTFQRLASSSGRSSSSAAGVAMARVGSISTPGRAVIRTPNFIPATSRGAVPHLTPDNLARENTPGAYLALEDFIERYPQSTPPIYSLPNLIPPTSSALRVFTCLPAWLPLIMGARRIAPLPCPNSNTNQTVAISSSFGFRVLNIMDYNIAAKGLKPDIVLAVQDMVSTERASWRRQEKMVQRTNEWLESLTSVFAGEAKNGEQLPKVFAPLLPVTLDMQQQYVARVAENSIVAGLSISEAETAGELAYLPERLRSLPVFSTAEALTPQEVLSMIAAGVDLFSLPFLNQAVDGGFMFTFAFGRDLPTNTASSGGLPLALSMWEPSIPPSAEPMTQTTFKGCPCPTCTRHNRTYLYHLLHAKEMLAWTLIAKHNMHVLTQFFAAVRSSIESGTLEQDIQTFHTVYSPDWPDADTALSQQETDDMLMDEDEEAVIRIAGMRTVKSSGNTTVGSDANRGPRNRGYQSGLKLGQKTVLLRSTGEGAIEGNGGPQPRKNEKAWRALPGGESDKGARMEVD